MSPAGPALTRSDEKWHACVCDEASPPPCAGDHARGLEGDNFPSFLSSCRDASPNRGSPRPPRRPPPSSRLCGRGVARPRAGYARQPLRGCPPCGRGPSGLKARRAPRFVFPVSIAGKTQDRYRFNRRTCKKRTGNNLGCPEKVWNFALYSDVPGKDRAFWEFPIPGRTGPAGCPGGIRVDQGARSVAEGDRVST